MPTYEPSYVTSYVPRIRIEVYIPKRFAPEYRDSLTWIIEEFTETYGGCTVHENAVGFYYSKSEAIIDEPMSVVYSDFDMDWTQPAERTKVLVYCDTLKQLLIENLSEEEVLISAFPVSHISHCGSV